MLALDKLGILIGGLLQSFTIPPVLLCMGVSFERGEEGCRAVVRVAILHPASGATSGVVQAFRPARTWRT